MIPENPEESGREEKPDGTPEANQTEFFKACVQVRMGDGIQEGGDRGTEDTEAEHGQSQCAKLPMRHQTDAAHGGSTECED